MALIGDVGREARLNVDCELRVRCQRAGGCWVKRVQLAIADCTHWHSGDLDDRAGGGARGLGHRTAFPRGDDPKYEESWKRWGALWNGAKM